VGIFQRADAKDDSKIYLYHLCTHWIYGLLFNHSIAARHNARIDFETGPEGTTFYVRFSLPVEDKNG